MLKVGFSRLDVTPPFGNDLSGYYVRRLADGILDPLYLNTVAINNGNDTLILMAIDYIGVSGVICNRIRSLISERTGIPTDNILFAALHQHTSPCLKIPEDVGETDLKDTAFVDVLIRKSADEAQMAIEDLREATMSTAIADVAEPIAFVRRYFTNKGVLSHPNPDKHIIIKRCAEADNSVRLVRFHRKDANDVAIINFSTHPDTIGGTKWSADWPGFTRRFVEEDIGEVSTIFFTGAEGDSIHVDYFKPKEVRMSESGYEYSKHMGRTIANAVISVWNKTKPETVEALFGKYQIVYNKTNLDGLEYYDDAVAYDKEYTEKASQGNWTSVDISHPYIQSIAHARRIMSLRTTSVFRSIPITLLSIGDVVLVGFGGEPFSSYSTSLKNLAPDKFILTAVCANGYAGYFPNTEAFEQGGYEVISSPFSSDLEEQILNAVDGMLKNI